LLLGPGVDDEASLALEEAPGGDGLVLRFGQIRPRLVRALRIHFFARGESGDWGRGAAGGRGHGRLDPVEDVGEWRVLPPGGVEAVRQR